MIKFEILPHTADIRIRVEGDNLQELFASALEGMNHILLTEPEKLLNEKVYDTIEINSTDVTILLIDFLSKILTISHQKYAIYNRVRFDLINNNKLKAAISGYMVYEFDEDIKAVTYTEAEITRSTNGYLTTVIVFDI